ncbi:MAG: hypothetical protein AAF378_20075 [Cyanobacteria bacterium P01_A01_bin.84]
MTKIDFNIKPWDTYDRKLEAIKANVNWEFQSVYYDSKDDSYFEAYFRPNCGVPVDDILLILLAKDSDQMTVELYFPDTTLSMSNPEERYTILFFKCGINQAHEANRIVYGYGKLAGRYIDPWYKPRQLKRPIS